MNLIEKSNKLNDVCYELRGTLAHAASKLEEEGHRIIHLNIGNPAPFGFQAPQEILEDLIINLPKATGYSCSKGLFSGRKAVMQYTQQKRIKGVTVDDIYLGNGVSELIMMSMAALLNDGDEVLLPAPDYPLWTATISLSGGLPIHYLCDESENWYPDLDDIRAKITSKTKALVIINPNNPTGAVYDKACLNGMLEIAREHKLVVFSDEIYDKILYDDTVHVSTAALADDLTIVTLNGLSKSYRCAGFRSGWLILSGDKKRAKGFIEGLDVLSSMRLCSNVPAQYVIQTALGGYQSVNDLILPKGRLTVQRDLAFEKLSSIPGVSCVKPQGALYLFPKFDPEIYHHYTDEAMILALLLDQKVLLMHGTGFHMPDDHHFRLVFLPNKIDLGEAIDRVAHFFEKVANSAIQLPKTS